MKHILNSFIKLCSSHLKQKSKHKSREMNPGVVVFAREISREGRPLLQGPVRNSAEGLGFHTVSAACFSGLGILVFLKSMSGPGELSTK